MFTNAHLFSASVHGKIHTSDKKKKTPSASIIKALMLNESIQKLFKIYLHKYNE